jgi:hypothetical protein
MLDPKTVAWLDQDDSLVADNIRRYGQHITMVNGGPCACCGDAPADQLESGPINFAYTTGLFGLGHPELLIAAVIAGLASAGVDVSTKGLPWVC